MHLGWSNGTRNTLVDVDIPVVAGEVKYCIAKLFSNDVKFATALDY
jgi:hypothetical protein